MNTMRVPVFAGEGKLINEDRSIPSPIQPDDVVVRVELCGICGTDLNILAVPPAHKARPGLILGHEATGRVAALGSAVNGVKLGERVVIAPRLTCGKCCYCRRGLDNQCEDYQSIGTNRDGAFAPYLLAPERALYRISARVPQADAAFFEPLSCVVGASLRAPLAPGDSVVIIGPGPIGCLFAMLYHIQGARQIILIGRSNYRLAFARSLDIGEVIDARQHEPISAVKELTGIGADLVVDAVGNQLNTAAQMTRRGGRVILFGLKMHENPPVNQYTITRNDLTIYGAFVGLKPFIQTIQLLESGLIQPSRLATHRLPLSDLIEGVQLMRSGQAMKVLIET